MSHKEPKNELLEMMEKIRHEDVNWRSGKIWSLVYHVSDEQPELLK